MTYKLDSTHLWRGLLTALGVTLALQLIRPFFSLVVNYFGEFVVSSLIMAAVPVLIVFLSPFLLLLIVRVLNPKRTLLLTVGGLIVARGVMQFAPSPAIGLVISAVGTGLGLMALPLGLAVVRTSDSPDKPIPPAWSAYLFTAGVVLGLALDTAINSAFLTWDMVWQPRQSGLTPIVVTGVECLAALIALWQIRGSLPDAITEKGFRNVLSTALLGAFFALNMLFLHSAPYVAGVTGFTMAGATALVLVGGALMLFTAGWVAKRQLPLPVRLFDGVALVVLIVLIPRSSGYLGAVLILVAQQFAVGLLVPALTGSSSSENKPGINRTVVVAGVGSLLFVVTIILYYVAQLASLPFSYAVLPPFAAVMLALAAFITVPTPDSGVTIPQRLPAAPLVLLIVPLLLFLMRPAAVTAALDGDEVRVYNYNIHYAVTANGWLDPAATVREIQRYTPDVVVIQEAGRGWLVGGGMDTAEYLSIGLQMPYVYAPAAGPDFGNVILSRVPIADWGFAPLPTEGIPMARSYIWVALDTEPSLRVIGVHLSAFVEAEDRFQQVDVMLEVWDEQPLTLIAGDMNSTPGQPDMERLLDAGLVSAQDAVGNADGLTFRSNDPYQRIDWIFGSDDLRFSNFVIPDTQASDHLPLSVTVTLPES